MDSLFFLYDNGVSKKLIPDVIKGVALALLNTLLAHGLLKNVDQSKLLKELEKRLQKLVDELAEVLPNTIRQADGTVVLKKAGKYHNSNSVKQEIKEKIVAAKKKPSKLVILPDEDKAVIHHNIVTYGFTEDEIFDMYAVRFSADYGVVVRIIDSSSENLHYVIISKWRLK